MSNLGLIFCNKTLIAELKSNAAVTALVNPSKIYPLIISSSTTPYPAISLSQAGWSCERAKASPLYPSVCEPIVQESINIDILIESKDYNVLNNITSAVVQALDGKSISNGGNTIESVRLENAVESVNGNDLSVYQKLLSFICII